MDEEDTGGTSHQDHSRTPCDELLGTKLEYSTVHTKADKGSHKVSRAVCVFCSLEYPLSPVLIRMHLDKQQVPAGKKRHFQLCTLVVKWASRHAEVVAALRPRQVQAKATVLAKKPG